jgi:class 3 adenylate cyclase/tetratricopeptide (TPR) repeat protein
MLCPGCGRQNPPDARFCGRCGARLEITCAACKTANPAGNRFCHQCGGALVTDTGPSSDTHVQPPDHLAEKILTSKAAMEGERKQVTVLFADLKGSMELLAERDPEDARKLLDPVIEQMMDAVHRYEGTVNQVMGDGIMALFGAPVAHEDHAVRACYAALAMQEAVRRHGETVRRDHGVTIRIRVGLNSGEVVVRAIGSDLRMDYTAVGQTTHLAARMEQLADPGTSFLTAETLALAEGFVRVSALGPMAVKGLSAPVDVYQLDGVSAVRSRLQAAAASGLSRFVGRDAEIEQLHRALEHAGAGRGQIVAVVGEPGVGKSRLTFELIHSHRVQGWLVLEAGALSYARTVSYLPVIDLLKPYFHIGDRDSPREIREKVTGKILTLDRSLDPMRPALLALFGLGDDPAWTALDPPQRRLQTLSALRGMLLREAHVQPLLVVMEDLHWIDPETQAFLDSLVESLPPARLLLLVNYRPEYQHHWGSKVSYTQLRLDPLAPESARDLLRSLVGEDATVAPLGPLLIERTEGNPFFLEESVRALVEIHALTGERGAYRLATPLHEVQVPPTVQAILAARIDRLSAEDKRLLQSAAVIGKDVPFSLLAAITEQPEDTLRQGLAHLQAGEFLYETSLFPELEYTFRHALTHDVAYLSLLRERRRQLHARTVAAIEQVYAGSLTEHVERLVDHAMRGEVWDKAAVYGVRAGSRATERSAHAQAKVLFETALEAIGRLPESRETLELGIGTRFLLGSPLFALGAGEAYLSFGSETVAMAERHGDPEQLATALAMQTNAHWFVGDNARALLFAQRGVEIADRLGRRTPLVHAYLNLGLVSRTVGEFPRALTLFTRVVEMLRGDGERERLGRVYYPSVAARSESAGALAQMGEFQRAAAMHDEALRVAEDIGHATSILFARLDVCQTWVRQGRFHEAIPPLETVNEALREAGLGAWRLRGLALLGYAMAMTGRPEGIGLLRDAVQQTARGRRYDEARWMADLSEAYAHTGQVDEARDLAERTLELARRRIERSTEAQLLHVLSEVDARTGRADAAESHRDAAITLARELGMRPLLARCHLQLGELYRRSGHTGAREQLASAVTMLRQMDMPFWLERGEAELRSI